MEQASFFPISEESRVLAARSVSELFDALELSMLRRFDDHVKLYRHEDALIRELEAQPSPTNAEEVRRSKMRRSLARSRALELIDLAKVLKLHAQEKYRQDFRFNALLSRIGEVS